MLTSVIDDKPVVSTWLDRLRLSRGISITEDDDASGNPLTLDDFLRRNHNTEITTGEDLATTSASNSPPSAPIPSDPELSESPLDPNPGEWYGVMSDVLSELFNFGGGSSSSSTISGKKLPRKQSNPKHCSVETPLTLQNQKRDSNFLPNATSSRNSYIKKPVMETKERRRTSVVEEEDDGVDEEGDKELVGFSRCEVTVIDTSFKIWKSEKMVFRRKNVWKVRDKKGKSRVVSSKKMKIKMKLKKKKRKCGDDDDEIMRKSKKMKISEAVSDNNPRYDIEEVHDDDDDPESSNVNRILLTRLPSKPRTFGLHTSKKNGEPEARGYRSLAEESN
ncbi:hypothetical protein AALP_AA8G421600 [Arabis alpina]|uniref:Uncharacterized protein n=1 Tax=Arabis alpina TaxID=50452 RepID=A0A087GCX5_ARAAL|nr:hypothetical protein AALP_AA8G421600 [Arabis alpina]